MRKIVILFTLLFIVSSVYSQNLLLNSSFETSDGTKPLYWEEDHDSWYTSSCDYITLGDAADGNSFVRITVEDASNDYYQGWVPDDSNYMLESGNNYHLRFSSRRNDTDLYPYIFIHLCFYYTEGGYAYAIENLTHPGYGGTPGVWTEESVDISLAPLASNVTLVGILSFSAGGGTYAEEGDYIEYDNIFLELLGSSSTPTPTSTPEPTNTPDPNAPTSTPIIDNSLLVGSVNFDGVAGSSAICRYNSLTGEFQEVFIEPPSGYSGFVQGPDGHYYSCGGLNNNVRRFNGITGEFIDEFVPADSGGLSRAVSLIFGPDGNLYVSSRNTDNVLRYNGKTGEFIDEFVTSGSGGLSEPVDIEFGPYGNLYVMGVWMVGVKRYNGQTGAFIDTFITPSSSRVQHCYFMCFGPDGYLYIAEHEKDCIYRFNSQTGAFVDTFISSTLLCEGVDNPDPREMAFGPDGNFYVATLGGKVIRFDGQTGEYIDDFIPPGSGGMGNPAKILFTTITDESNITYWSNY